MRKLSLIRLRMPIEPMPLSIILKMILAQKEKRNLKTWAELTMKLLAKDKQMTMDKMSLPKVYFKISIAECKTSKMLKFNKKERTKSQEKS